MEKFGYCYFIQKISQGRPGVKEKTPCGGGNITQMFITG